jgi:lipoprotein signal peptidase
MLFGVAGVIVALDQWTKWLVRENIRVWRAMAARILEWLSPYARFVHWYNRARRSACSRTATWYSRFWLHCDRRDHYYYPLVEKVKIGH